ncbi:haloacid dehalogenase [Micromonospora echinospora]|uniref:Putative hydrolase of the HAD superfamily n=1 Tax=Micromonospora echinospora TaxID=1877 RepID=A0A1C4UQE5_MICEC|nr:HAD-IA family hydrolase [Micromonospora echinospora]OZV77634.1 haloacid dehalogenase [Micromonospora echinospora]SCE73861.1 putative hydrolase of the HAD superfamily [Micromonospora echinospora]
MARERATALLVDFDGVLRRWDPAVAAGVERRYGLTPGVLGDIAMQWGRLQPVLVGQVSHADWMTSVADALASQSVDAERARAAVAEWQAYRGEVDPDVLAFVREVRAAGIPVGLATNATDLLDADLAALGLTDELDAVVNSSALGVHKPAKEYFRAACEALRTPPDRVLFVDDDDRMISGARVAGLSAYRWSGPEGLRYVRAALAY